MSSQREFFNSRAKDWEARCYPPAARLRLEELTGEFHIRPSSCVLDIGTGTGILQPFLRRLAGPQGIIVAFDLSENMLRQACKKLLGERDLFFQGDACCQALRTASFDHLICFAAFPHFPDQLQALREMARVAKSGAELIIAHLMSREELARHHGGCGIVADDVLPNAEAMRQLFLAAGLEEPEIIDRPGRYLARARKPAAAAVQAGFERRAVFTALKQHDVMGHSHVRRLLEQIVQSLPRPFRLLDIGCGDGADIAAALAASRISTYLGVDSSGEALAEADKNLARLPCPVRLLCGDYREALQGGPASFDLIWMGLFLHHLPDDEKKAFLATACALLAPGGLLLAHDPLLAENEGRTAYIARLEAHGRRHWQFLTEEQMRMASWHWSAHGRQESFYSLRNLGLQAGFKEVSLLWTDADRFYGLLCFQRP